MMRSFLSISTGAAIISMLVLLAMTVDLACGVTKAKRNHEARTSYGLARTISKFLAYEGAVIVGAAIDCLLMTGRVWSLVRLDAWDGVPIVCSLLGVFLCAIEVVSIFESAKTKDTKRHIKELGALVSALSNKDVLDMMTTLQRITDDHHGRRPESDVPPDEWRDDHTPD